MKVRGIYCFVIVAAPTLVSPGAAGQECHQYYETPGGLSCHTTAGCYGLTVGSDCTFTLGGQEQHGTCQDVCTIPDVATCACCGVERASVGTAQSVAQVCEAAPIRAVSGWGLGALALLLLSSITLKFGRRRAAA